jgi:hypothetical protein
MRDILRKRKKYEKEHERGNKKEDEKENENEKENMVRGRHLVVPNGLFLLRQLNNLPVRIHELKHSWVQ